MRAVQGGAAPQALTAVESDPSHVVHEHHAGGHEQLAEMLHSDALGGQTCEVDPAGAKQVDAFGSIHIVPEKEMHHEKNECVLAWHARRT